MYCGCTLFLAPNLSFVWKLQEEEEGEEGIADNEIEGHVTHCKKSNEMQCQMNEQVGSNSSQDGSDASDF